MIRRLPVFLFIFTSLFSQATTAFACKMTGQIMLRCCCEDGAAAAAPAQPSHGHAQQESCCDEITLPGDASAGEAAKTSAKQPGADFDDQPWTMAAVVALPPDFDRSRPPTVHPPTGAFAAGTRTYLLTLRLRI